MSIQFLVILLVLTIPILGIFLAGYKEWLKFKAKHQELGTSTQEVEDRLRSLHERLDQIEAERDALQERVQNLETIVTSEAWIAQHDDTVDVPPLDAAEGGDLELPPERDTESRSDAERTADLARRLREQ